MGQRLTERQGNTVAYIGQHTQLPGLECASTMRVAAIRDVMQRLADYEDTGLDPEQIPKAAERQAPLPCMYCTPDVLRRGQYVTVKTIIGRPVQETNLTYCWNCGRKIKEDK